MSRKLASSKNRGQSLFGSNSGNILPQNEQIYIGIVDHVVEKNSDDVVTYTEDDELVDYLDDRHSVYVIPITNKSEFTVNKCHMMNSHNVDIPIVGEAVLICKTSIGNIIIDRLSPNAFGINYDLADYLLNNEKANVSVNLTDEAKDELGLRGIDGVKPFNLKMGSKAFLGRNNQYMIFDYGNRKGGDSEEIEYSSEGNFLRIGIKSEEDENIKKEDPTNITLVTNGKVQSVMDGDIESEFNESFDEEADNGMGFQGDELVFVGRQFIVIYSQRDMLLSGDRNLNIDFKETTIKSEKIKMGSSNSNEPNVLGNEIVQMVDELISIIESIKHIIPQGQTAGLSPQSILKLKRFKSKYVRRNNSPIHSNKVFLE